MSEHNGSASPFVDVTHHLFGHLLALESYIGAIEVLCINPGDRLTIDFNVVEEQNIWRQFWTTDFNRLLFDKFRLTA